MSNNFKEAGFAHILIQIGGLIFVLLIGAYITSNIKTTKEYPQNSNVKGLLAKGGDDDNSGSSGSNDSSSDSGSSGSSSGSERSGSGSSGSDNTTIKVESRPKSSASGSPSSGVRVKTEQSTDKQKTEIKFSEDEKIKTRIEEDRTRIDVYSGGIKVRYEIKDGRVVVKAETEEGENVPEQELFKIEDRLDKSGIKIAIEGGKLLVARNSVGALSNFPLQIDLNTNQLIASTSAGTKVLTVLPDQAIQNMLAANVISRLNTQELISQTQLGNLTSVADVITLGERNEIPIYEIRGLKEHNLFGFIPITTETKVFVSAETGQEVAIEQSLLANIVDLLSP